MYNWERRNSATEKSGTCGNPNKIDTQKECQFGYILFDHLLLEFRTSYLTPFNLLYTYMHFYYYSKWLGLILRYLGKRVIKHNKLSWLIHFLI